MSRSISIVKYLKVPGGKLLEVELIIDTNTRTIRSLYITGDFFAYPPEIVDEAERAAKNTRLDYKLVDRVLSILSKGELHGITLDHVRKLLREAVSEGLKSTSSK